MVDLRRPIEHYKKAIELMVQIQPLSIIWEWHLLPMNQADEAINQFKEALNIKPDFPEVYNDMGKVFCYAW